MKKLLIILIIVLALLTAVTATSPVQAQDFPIPPQNPDESWWPPYGGGLMDPAVGAETYNQTQGNLVIPQPSTIVPGTSSSLVDAYLVSIQVG